MSGTALAEAPCTRDKMRDAFERAVITGLSQSQKTLPTAYLYDARGSELFEEITELDEYYLIRTETLILENCASDWGAGLAQGTVTHGQIATISSRFMR